MGWSLYHHVQYLFVHGSRFSMCKLLLPKAIHKLPIFNLVLEADSSQLPVHGVWTNWMYKTPPVQCINVFAAVYIAAGMSITHDIMILCMPIPTLWRLNLGLRKKLNLMVMFGVGSFVIVASVIRLPSLMKMGASSDPSCKCPLSDSPSCPGTPTELANRR
mgnify:CR=1 FL=1